MQILRSLLADEAGFAFTAEFIVVSVMTVAIVIVGGASVRDSLIQELADWAVAVGALNQSYQFGATSTPSGTGVHAAANGSGFFDQTDVGDDTGIEFFPVCGLDDPSSTNILE
ncbi:MAG: hypothetical protein O3B86_18305 [Planctomycetota bacterium]|nr:hypothetical protein [Planctomycetota bacterium]MDA1250970.1 hypothetical protein [Planctomycetota bacterium]